MELYLGLRILSLCIGSFILVYASYSDVRTREVSNVVWVVIGVSGILFAIVELFIGSLSLFQVFKSLIAGAIFAFLLHILNFGGADVKAVISLALLFPSYPYIYLSHLCLPVTGIPPLGIFVFSMLTNAILITISAPLCLFLYNLFLRRDLSPLMFIGWQVRISNLRAKKHYKLMHQITARVKPEEWKYVWGGIEPTEEILSHLEALNRKGKIRKVWITPELPFIVYLTAGFFIAVLYGDFISAIVFA